MARHDECGGRDFKRGGDWGCGRVFIGLGGCEPGWISGSDRIVDAWSSSASCSGYIAGGASASYQSFGSIELQEGRAYGADQLGNHSFMRICSWRSGGGGASL